MRFLGKSSLIACLAAMGCGNPAAQNLSKSKEVVEFNQEAAMKIGRGYDSLTTKVLGTCVELSSPVEPSITGSGQELTFSLEKIENLQSLFNKIEAPISLTGPSRYRGRVLVRNPYEAWLK